MSNTLVYSSQTGVESDEPLVVEQVISKKLRVNDATYGLKTAAKVAHDKVAREQFFAQKAAAIAKQRTREAARKQERMDVLDADITRINTSLLTGTSSDPAKAKALLAKLVAKRKALVV